MPKKVKIAKIEATIISCNRRVFHNMDFLVEYIIADIN